MFRGPVPPKREIKGVGVVRIETETDAVPTAYNIFTFKKIETLKEQLWLNLEHVQLLLT